MNLFLVAYWGVSIPVLLYLAWDLAVRPDEKLFSRKRKSKEKPSEKLPK